MTFGPNGSLTPAEIRTVRVVAQGKTNKEAAKLLGLSPHTVNSQVRSAYTKLGVSSRQALTNWVMLQVSRGDPGFLGDL